MHDRVAEMRGDSCGSAGQGSCGRARPGWPVNAPAVLRCAPVQDDTVPARQSRPFRACSHGQTYVEQAILGFNRPSLALHVCQESAARGYQSRPNRKDGTGQRPGNRKPAAERPAAAKCRADWRSRRQHEVRSQWPRSRREAGKICRGLHQYRASRWRAMPPPEGTQRSPAGGDPQGAPQREGTPRTAGGKLSGGSRGEAPHRRSRHPHPRRTGWRRKGAGL